MSLQAIPPRPLPAWLRVIHDRNPFYLLSALSMFVGYRIVIAALNAPAGDGRALLGLIGVMQAYEAVIIALALYLIVRRGLHRDGWILLGVQALFLVDLTNLNAELYTAMPRLGSAVAAATFGLALVKVGVVARVLGLRIRPATAACIAAQLAALFVLPGLFRLLRAPDATVSPLHIYAVWWFVAALATVGWATARSDPRNVGHPMAPLVGRLYLAVPLASLLVHLASENRVYWVHFQPANVAPLLLAAVVAVHRWLPRFARLEASVLLVAGAALLSIVPAEYRSEMTGHVLWFAVSPLRLALAAGGLTLLGLAVVHRSLFAGCAMAVCALVALLGSDLWQILHRLAAAVRWTVRLLERLIPQTPLEWGYAAIAGAFLLLGLGALVSLRGGRPAEPLPAQA